MCTTTGLIVFVIVLTFGLSAAKDGEDDIRKGFVLVGDMILTEKQSRYFSQDSIKRTGLENPFYRWPKGVVPVIIDWTFGESFIATIKKAAKHISDNTCIQFLYDIDPKQYPNHLEIVRSEKLICRSEVGYSGLGKQEIRISTKKCKQGSIVHELLHTLGLLHMHTATERDEFVRIRYKNIIPGYEGNFDKSDKQVSMFNTPYDYLSIMHYSQYAFSIDKKTKKTIAPAKNAVGAKGMGQRNGMSAGDILRINRMYNCPGRSNDFIAYDQGGNDEDPLVVITDESQVTGPINHEPED